MPAAEALLFKTELIRRLGPLRTLEHVEPGAAGQPWSHAWQALHAVTTGPPPTATN